MKPAACLRESARVKLALARTHGKQFARAVALLKRAIRRGNKVLLFGNGGSAADAQHLAAELVGHFIRERRALPAIALTTDTSALTAIGNDYGYERVFSRQIEALAKRGDVVIAISTSGSSPNVIDGIRAARAAGAEVIGLTGARGVGLAAECDVVFVVPSSSSPRIQEAHIAIGHILCEAVDEIG
jgi:D-sedoheptulose 7-phosphate isomerase